MAFDQPDWGWASGHPTSTPTGPGGPVRGGCRGGPGLDRFHLVVHDMGDPVGFKMPAILPRQVRSLTIFNTRIQVDHFAGLGATAVHVWPLVGELWLP